MKPERFIRDNRRHLEALGAFEANEPELHEFDQLVDNNELLGQVLAGSTIDVYIDDGLHSIESILMTMATALPHLSDRFVYFVEDNRDAHAAVASQFPDLEVHDLGEMCVATPRV